MAEHDFEEKIKKALADKTIWANFEDLDSHEAVPYLAKYLEKTGQTDIEGYCR